MKPISRFLSYVAVGGAAALVGYIALPRHLDQRPAPPSGAEDNPLLPGGYAEVVVGGEIPKHIEDVATWKSPRWSGGRAYRVIELEVVHGEAFVNDRHIPRGDVTAYVDARVAPDCNYVILFPAKGSTMGDVIPVLDACRKSKVMGVILNYCEVP